MDSTKLLVDSLSQLKKKPKLLLSASAVGFYGFDDAESLFDESADAKGNGLSVVYIHTYIPTYIRAYIHNVYTHKLRGFVYTCIYT